MGNKKEVAHIRQIDNSGPNRVLWLLIPKKKNEFKVEHCNMADSRWKSIVKDEIKRLRKDEDDTLK